MLRRFLKIFGTLIAALSLAIVQVPAFAAPATPSAPVKPQLSVASLPTQTQIAVTWLAPFENSGIVTDYTVQYSSDSGVTWSSFAHAASTVTNLTITGLTAGAFYSVRVRAESAAGSSSWAIAAPKHENFETIAAGEEFSCAVAIDGTVQCWGRNSSGQLGDSTIVDRASAGFVSGITTAKAITAGFAHACALLTSGDVMCWGANTSGQLGNNTTSDSSIPVKVLGLPAPATAISAGNAHTCAVTTESKVYCWGANSSSQLGLGDTTQRLQAGVSVTGITTANQVAAGGSHTCARLGTGIVQCWGANASGQIGDGSLTTRSAPAATGLTTASQVLARGNSSCAVLSTGSMKCWGENTFGQLGIGNTSNQNSAVDVSGVSSAASGSMGNGFTCIVTLTNTVKCWGKNTSSQLGNATTTDSTIAVDVSGVLNASAVAAGGSHACAVVGGGQLECWGLNAAGQLGTGNPGPAANAANIVDMASLTSIDAGDSHTCGVRTDGRVVCWGLNTSGQLGNGLSTSPGRPVLVLSVTNAIAVTAGGDHTCALLAGGSVSCWGANTVGQLGNGTTVDSAVPVSVSLGAAAVAVSAGRNHTCAVLVNTEVRCWGLNSSGQLGRGDTINSSSPIAVVPVNPLDVAPALVGASAVSAGGAYTCVLKADSTVVCFGSNLSGQFGDGSTTSNSRPVLIPLLADAIATGDAHTCAVRAGAISCWGLNTFGQVGNGSNVDAPSPATLAGITTASGVYVGSNHTCITLADLTVQCWGLNTSGQLGDGTTTNRNAPVAATGVTRTSNVTLGAAHSCAVNNTGALTCWGTNTNNERGNAALSVVALQLGAAPSAPTAVIAGGLTNSASVSWTPGAANGARITSYTVTSNPVAGSCTTTVGTNCVVTGLVNGTAYTFTVTATNIYGTSSASVASNRVTPAGVPGAPTLVTGTPGNSEATVSWIAPTDTGGSAITGYVVSSSPASIGCTTTVGVDATPTTCTVTGLTNNVGYTFTVRAINAVGNSVASLASATVTPLPFPAAPTAVIGTRGDQKVTVRWTPPIDNADPVSSFVVTASPGGNTCTNTVGIGPANTCDVTGLINGTVYTFTVVSRNISGSSPRSLPSAGVTPAGLPQPPVGVTATRGNGQATVSWTAGSDNGSPIINYIVTSTDAGGFTCSTASTSCTVTGLTNGTAYSFTVVSINSVGTSATASAVTNTVTPATTPSSPLDVVAVRGDQSASVSWTAAADNGEPITSYVVTSLPGGKTCTVIVGVSLTPTSCQVSGLTNGVPYTFTVAAFNLLGASLPSFASNSVTPAGVPTAPGLVTAVRGAASATVSWLPSDPNGTPLIGYTVTSTPGGLTCTSSGLTCVVSGLTNGTSYSFTVTATNAMGVSAASPSSNAVSPADAPAAPSSVVAVDGDQSATVSWLAPSANGSPVLGYTVTAQPGGATCSTVVGTDALPTSCVVRGLTNGTLYTFSVTATNLLGVSASSTASNAVTPAGVPTAPTSASAIRGDQQAVISWNAAEPNGSAITGYVVTSTPGGLSCTTATTTCTVQGLTNGVGYTFAVVAQNRAGNSAPSVSTSAVTPAGKPLQPIITAVDQGYRTATIHWADGRSNGEAITSVVVVATPSGASCTVASGTSCTISNLTNGTKYTFVVTATNALGESLPSEATAQVMIGAVPYAPTSLIGESGDQRVTLRWIAADGRDFPILNYKVTANPGGRYCTTDTTTCIVTGLTNGVSYTFTVTATNIIGESLPSAETMTLIPSGPPISPDFVTVIRSSGRVEIRWTAADGNGSPVTGYSVLASPGGRTCITTTQLSCVIDGLTNGTAYTFAVSATNLFGTSTPRVSESATPAAVADAPTDVTASAGNKQAVVRWKKPANNNGSVITGYRVISSPSAGECTTDSGDAVTCTVTGLTNGTAYRFIVIAINDIGNSLPSVVSAAVSPSSKPTPVGKLVATSQAASKIKLVWSGANRNGATLVKYEFSYRVVGAAKWGAWVSAAKQTWWTLRGLKKGTSYQFRFKITTSDGSAISKTFLVKPTL